METVTSSWFNLEKTIFNQKTKVYTARMINCDISNSAVEEGDRKPKGC